MINSIHKNGGSRGGWIRLGKVRSWLRHGASTLDGGAPPEWNIADLMDFVYGAVDLEVSEETKPTVRGASQQQIQEVMRAVRVRLR